MLAQMTMVRTSTADTKNEENFKMFGETQKKIELCESQIYLSFICYWHWFCFTLLPDFMCVLSHFLTKTWGNVLIIWLTFSARFSLKPLEYWDILVVCLDWNSLASGIHFYLPPHHLIRHSMHVKQVSFSFNWHEWNLLHIIFHRKKPERNEVLTHCSNKSREVDLTFLDFACFKMTRDETLFSTTDALSNWNTSFVTLVSWMTHNFLCLGCGK